MALVLLACKDEVDITADRWLSKTLLTINECGSKIATVFSIVIWQSKTLFCNDFVMIFYLCPLIVLTFFITAYPVWIYSNSTIHSPL